MQSLPGNGFSGAIHRVITTPKALLMVQPPLMTNFGLTDPIRSLRAFFRRISPSYCQDLHLNVDANPRIGSIAVMIIFQKNCFELKLCHYFASQQSEKRHLWLLELSECGGHMDSSVA
jgi:hypothetical protein